MRPTALALCFLVVCGAVTGWLVAGLVPAALRQPHLETNDFVLARTTEQPKQVTPSQWWLDPFVYGDFDLHIDLELGENVDLDLLLRQVEPRFVDGQKLPFQGRFTVLRLSTRQAGPAWRTREQALLEPHGGGVALAPGLPATVKIEARGRLLRANIAGRWLPWCEADDVYGMMTMIARGGPVVVHSLQVRNLGPHRPWLWSRGLWAGLGAFGALLLVAGVWASRRSLRLLVLSSFAPPLMAWLLVGHFDLAMGFPPPAALLSLLVACLATWLLWLRRWPFVAVVAVYLLAGAGTELSLLRDDRAVDAVFGERAGAELSEAHGRYVRGPGGLHDVGRPGPRVFLLGGRVLYDRGQPAEHVELLLTRELKAATKRAVDVPCLPTVLSSPAQQWRLFTTCYVDYRPEVLVFGVGEDAGPTTTPAQLRDLIAAARAHCASNGARLVLFADAATPAELLGVLRAEATAPVVFVAASPGAAPPTVAKELAAAIVPLLP